MSDPGERAGTRCRRVRVGPVAGPVVFGASVVALSLPLVLWQGQQRAHAPAATPARFPGAATMGALTSHLPAARLDVPVDVAIVRDPANDDYYDSRQMMDSVVERWRGALLAIGAQVRVLTPREALHDTRARVLVLPSSPCLGRDARHAIARATAHGQGLVLTWLTGVRDGACRTVGYGMLVGLAGAARVDTLHPRPDGYYVTFLRGGPLATDIPPAARLELAGGNHVAVRAPSREAYFSDYMLNPEAVRGEPLLDGAVDHAIAGRSRVVYWGFDLLRVVPTQWNDTIALLLVRNSIAWAAGTPLVSLQAWPNAKTAAVVIAQDVEAQFANARYALDSLRAAGVPGTYFVVSSLALRHASLTRALAAQGEVGSHTPRHRLLGGATDSTQAAALARTQRELRDVLGHPVSGLRPPEEQFDGHTLSEWSRAGGRYVFATNNGRTASPEIVTVNGRSVVLLGRVLNDDFISVRRAGITDVHVLARDYLAALAKVKALGGLYILSYHSQMLARPELVPALAAVARAAAADTSLWTATAGQVADWWIARSMVDVSARFTDANTVELTVHNGGHTTVRGAAARLALGAAPTVLRVEGARLLPAAAANAPILLLPDLSPSSSRTVTIVLRPRATRRTDAP